MFKTTVHVYVVSTGIDSFV